MGWREFGRAVLARFDAKPEEVSAAGHEDVHRTMRRGLMLLGIGLGGFLLWAVLIPLDEGVPVPGLVTLDTKRKTIQHQTGGIVAQVLVHEGQQVRAGDELVVLDDGLARANFESVRQRYIGLRAMECRLLAEQGGQDEIIFHPDVLQYKDDPIVSQHMISQSQLLRSRSNALRSELATYSESIKAQEEAIKGYSSQIDGMSEQLRVAQQEWKGLRDLVVEGYAPRNKMWEHERLTLQQQINIDEMKANIARAKGSVAELQMRRQQRLNEARKEVDSQLAEVQREVTADAEKFHEAQEELNRTRIRSPVAGAVVGLAAQTVGGVVAPGARLMDIVPKDEALILEAHIPPHLIDQVKVGQPADVRFQGFVNTPELAVEGSLLSVSADLLNDPATNQSYFLARISVTPKGLKQLGGRSLQPGMPVQVVIKSGERTLLKYFLDPVIKRMSWAMKEA